MEDFRIHLYDDIISSLKNSSAASKIAIEEDNCSIRFAKSCIPNEESLDHKGRVAVDIIAKIHKLICD